MNKEEIENAILGVKGIIKVGEQINANYKTRLADLEKELEQLTSFKRSMGVNTISGMTNSCNIAINAYIPYRENYSGILDILDATFAMLDLANQCNAKFEEDEKQKLSDINYKPNFRLQLINPLLFTTLNDDPKCDLPMVYALRSNLSNCSK